MFHSHFLHSTHNRYPHYYENIQLNSEMFHSHFLHSTHNSYPSYYDNHGQFYSNCSQWAMNSSTTSQMAVCQVYISNLSFKQFTSFNLNWLDQPLWRYGNSKIWPSKFRFKFMDKVKGEGHIPLYETYHSNNPTTFVLHKLGQQNLTIHQIEDLTLKIQGQDHGQFWLNVKAMSNILFVVSLGHRKLSLHWFGHTSILAKLIVP